MISWLSVLHESLQMNHFGDQIIINSSLSDLTESNDELKCFCYVAL